MTLVPQSGSEVLLPDTKALTFDLSYSQDPAVGTADASFFDAELSFDHTRVTLDQTSSLFDNDQITWDVTTSGVIAWRTISCSSVRAPSHCLLFSHALVAAL